MKVFSFYYHITLITLYCFYRSVKAATAFIYHATFSIKSHFYSSLLAFLGEKERWKTLYLKNSIDLLNALLFNPHQVDMPNLMTVTHFWIRSWLETKYSLHCNQFSEMKAETRDFEGLQNCQRYQIVWREQASVSYQLNKHRSVRLVLTTLPVTLDHQRWTYF